MPNMDGFEAVARIRAGEIELVTRSTAIVQRVPIVAVTANAMAGDRQACLAAGFDDYISKPYKAQALIDVLSCWLDPKAAARRPQASNQADSFSPLTEIAGKETTFDPTALDHLLALQRPGGGEAMKKRIFDTFEKSISRLLAQCDLAMTSGDATSLRVTAHALKSAAANVGAYELSRLARKLEQLARAGNSNGEMVLAQIKQEYDAVHAAMLEFLYGTISTE